MAAVGAREGRRQGDRFSIRVGRLAVATVRGVRVHASTVTLAIDSIVLDRSSQYISKMFPNIGLASQSAHLFEGDRKNS